MIDEELFDQIVSVRRDLHQHPELSWKETRTASAVAAFLDRLGIPYRVGVGQTGIVADLPGPGGVRCVALRADMDALPILEETELPFSSIYPGIMHACGHDGHTSMLLGAAALLAKEGSLPAPVRLIFQPAEEKGSGARTLIEEGVLENVGMIFGGHLDRHYPTGVIVVSEGVVNASSDTFRIDIIGQGAHGARPHESIDAVVVGSLMVMALQTIVSREIDPTHPSVVSVGLFQGGTASNVIAGQARLEGTVRAQLESVRQQLTGSIKRIAESIGHLHGAKVDVEIRHGTPPLSNRAPMAALAREAAVATVGEESVMPLKTANMGAEDFSYYLEKIPGAYVRFGSQVPGREGFPAHSSKFDFDEKALGVGARFFYWLAHTAGRELQKER